MPGAHFTVPWGARTRRMAVIPDGGRPKPSVTTPWPADHPVHGPPKQARP